MPIYDYKCSSCGKTFETRQSFYDDPVASCPVCGKSAERQITAVAVHFKGSGFYKTDYGSSSRSSNGNGKSTDTKSDSADGKKDVSPKSDKSSESGSKDSAASPKKSEKKETTKVSD
ncbi:MAG: zinc ribbon domain-containing protein [SAR202 cluster bacterium]|nr:zinc ribbon domain-containing protein [SAR202 cluster bacterium]